MNFDPEDALPLAVQLCVARLLHRTKTLIDAADAVRDVREELLAICLDIPVVTEKKALENESLVQQEVTGRE